MYYSQHEHSTLMDHNAIWIACRLYCIMSGCHQNCLSTIVILKDYIDNVLRAFH